MDVHFGVIRDKQGIYSALKHSQESNRQLAVCFTRDGKLLVKICTVQKIIGKNDGALVVLRSQGGDEGDTTIPLDGIQSVYPIRDFIE